MFLIAKTLHGGNYLNIYDLVDRCASILLSSDIENFEFFVKLYKGYEWV